jgi:hypothetical protein
MEETTIGARERFEAIARSVRDVLSQRWVRTEKNLRARESEARLLPLNGISHRPLARQQCHEPSLMSHERSRQAKEPRLARVAGAGT